MMSWNSEGQCQTDMTEVSGLSSVRMGMWHLDLPTSNQSHITSSSWEVSISQFCYPSTLPTAGSSTDDNIDFWRLLHTKIFWRGVRNSTSHSPTIWGGKTIHHSSFLVVWWDNIVTYLGLKKTHTVSMLGLPPVSLHLWHFQTVGPLTHWGSGEYKRECRITRQRLSRTAIQVNIHASQPSSWALRFRRYTITSLSIFIKIQCALNISSCPSTKYSFQHCLTGFRFGRWKVSSTSLVSQNNPFDGTVARMHHYWSNLVIPGRVSFHGVITPMFWSKRNS